jgi:predicted permease
VAVISYGYWQRRFAGAADVVGRTLTLEGVTFTIVGVAPSGFSSVEPGRGFDVAVPLGTEPLLHRQESWLDPNNTSSPFRLMVRLRPGSSVETITAAIRGLQVQIRSATVPRSWPVRARNQYLVDPFTFVRAADANWSVRRRFEQPLLTMLSIVSLVLLVACGNVANLQLARANARRAELSVRHALGASRWRIVRQLLTESIVLSVFGSAIGIAVAAWASPALVAQISTDANPVMLDLSLDRNVIAFTAALATVTTLLFGVAPAWHFSRTVALDALRAQGRESPGEAGGRVSGGLIIAQVALSLVLIVGAGLLGRTFAALVARDKGFDPHQVLIVNIDSTRSTIPPAERSSVYERCRQAVTLVAGVSDAALSFATPVVTGPVLSQPIRSVADGPELALGQRQAIAASNAVSPGWFRAMGIRLLAGRDVRDTDRQNMPAVVVVNHAFAQRFFGGTNPVGKTITLWLPARRHRRSKSWASYRTPCTARCGVLHRRRCTCRCHNSAVLGFHSLGTST